MGLFYLINKVVLVMGLMRLISGTIEMSAGLFMLRLNDIEKALMVNSALALVGPVVLMTTTAVGLIGIAEKLSLSKLLWILLGVACIFMGIRSR